MAPDAEACDLRVCLLGGFRAFVGPRPVADAAWRRRKARSLVKLLALAPGHRLHREQLLDALWPDLPPAAALNNLHKVLYLARRALEPELPATRPSAYLLFQDDLVLLSSPRTLWIDVDAFRDAATQAHRVRTPDAYRAALALCGGDLLPEDPYEDWVAPRREECRAQFLALLLGQARAHEERGEREQAVEALHRVLLSEPAHEEAHVGLMRLHARGGQRHLALRQYAQLREALARELDAEPDPASQELHAAILAGRLPPSLPVSPSTDAGGAGADAAPGERRGARDEAGSPREPPSNLPAQLSSFIGRQREIAEARRLLATTRLLTLTGAGGCGKSRLGIELAAAVAPQFPDGVWLAELASLHDPTLLVASVQAALDIPDQPGQAGAGALVGYLRDKRALLVLDNCEHLVDACAPLVVTLLRACPRLRVLATSREPLRIDGETIYRVPPLSLPPADRSAGDDLLRFDAVRLFVERARAVAPTFAITPPSRRPVVEVCRRLDGMPLALELAAARLGLLSIHQIAERLDDCFRLLTAGNRAGLPRHRTLRATLEWSHRLLADPERALFRRLAVFAGGFSLAAAEAIGDGVGCQGSGVGEGTSLPDTLSVLDLLGQLVHKSLVVVEEQGNEPRYRLLETVRQYARERLVESGELGATRARHRAWYVALTEQAEREVWRLRQGWWLDRLQAEHDNLRLALASSLEDDVASALRLAGNLWRFWIDRGFRIEGLRWLERALAATGASGPRGRALLGFGILSRDLRDLVAAKAALDEAVAVFRDRGETWHLGFALVTSADLAAEQGDRQRARELYEASLAVQTEAGDKQGMAVALAYLGRHLVWDGDRQLARSVLERAAALHRETGSWRGLGFSLRSLAVLARREGDWRRAKELLRESLVISRNFGHGPSTVYSIDELGRLAANEGQFARAARLLAAVTASELSRLWSRRMPAEDAERDACLAEARAALGEEAFASAWAAGVAMHPDEAVEEALAMDEVPGG